LQKDFFAISSRGYNVSTASAVSAAAAVHADDDDG